MTMATLLMLVVFAGMLLMNVPVACAIALSTLVMLVAASDIAADVVIAQRMACGTESFALLAIPFFVLAGILMGRGGIARRLIDFAGTLVGRFPGGLAYMNTLTCMLFGALSGSAAAAISSIGGFMIPEMNRKGYNREFNVAVTSCAATTGLLIPPSNIMIVYALSAGSVSIAAMFMAGVLPGILVGLAIMVAAGVISAKRGYGRGAAVTVREALMAFLRAIPSLSLIGIVLGGILGGIFTATEAAAISVVYAFILAVPVYREVKLSELPGILLETGITTSVVMLLIGCSSAMSWVLTHQGIPQAASQALIGVSSNPIVILLMINVMLLIVGTFMDMTPAVLIFTPILLPVVSKLGIHPVHFGMVMITNLCIGLCTPPVGTCLFLGCGIGQTTIAKTLRPMLPFFAAMFVALMLITYVPWFSLFLPRALGLIK